MTHLSAEQLLEFADGQAPDARAAAHLRRCPDCRSQWKALSGVVRDLAVLPAPPPAWRQSAFRRLGLLPRERPRAWRWAWAPALAAVLVLAWILPLRDGGTPEPPAVRTGIGLTQGTAASHPSASANSLAAASSTVSMAHRRAIRVGSPAQMASLSRAVPKAFGFSKVRNNLIRPDKEGSLNFALSIPRSGSLTVQVMDDRGGTVATLFDAPAGPGKLDLSWNGAGAHRGIYTIVASINGSSVSFKSLLV